MSPAHGSASSSAQQLGFTLEEVRSLLQLQNGKSYREARLLSEQKLAITERRLTHFRVCAGVIKQLGFTRFSER